MRLEDCLENIEKILKIKVAEHEQLIINLSAPEVLADLKLTKYYLSKLRDEETIVFIYKEILKIINEDENDQDLLMELIKEALFLKKGMSKKAKIEIESNDERKREWMIGLLVNCFKEFNINFSKAGNIITINSDGAYEMFEDLFGGYSIDGKQVYVYVTCEELDFKFNKDKVKFDIFRASKKGGQNLNKVETAVRATYLDTNDVVICQDERSQLQNKERAIKRLEEEVLKNYKKNIIAKNKEVKTNARKNKSMSMTSEEYLLFFATWLLRKTNGNT